MEIKVSDIIKNLGIEHYELVGNTIRSCRSNIDELFKALDKDYQLQRCYVFGGGWSELKIVGVKGTYKLI